MRRCVHSPIVWTVLACLAVWPSAGWAKHAHAAAVFTVGVPLTLTEAFAVPGHENLLQQPTGQQIQVVTEVVVNGLKTVHPEAVRAVMKLKPGEQYSDTQMLADADAVTALGLFQNVLPHAEMTTTGVRIVVDVVENPIITAIEFGGEGTKVATQRELAANMTLRQSQIKNDNILRSDVEKIRKYLLEKKGYFAEVESVSMAPDKPGPLHLNITLIKVKSIKLEGLHETKSKVVFREMKTRVGSFYNWKTWKSDMSRVFNLDLFDEVAPLPESEPDYDTVGLGLKFKERRSGSLNVGFSYSETQQLVGFLQITKNNLFGMGQSAYVNLQRANINNGFSVDVGYTNPWADSKHTGLSVSLYDKLIFRFSSTFFGGVSGDPNSDNQYNERRTGGSFSLSRPIGDRRSAFAGARIEGVRTNNVSTLQNDQFIQQDGNVQAINFGASDNTRDLDLDPAGGHYFRVSSELGSADITHVGGLFADQDVLGRHGFSKVALDIRFYLSPEGPREKPDSLRHVLAFRLYGGTVAGTIPFFEQYFAGGAESIRGYAEDRYWGKNVAFGNLEYRIPIQKAMTLVTFFDYGDAWGGYGTVNTFSQASKFTGHYGYGVGLHFRTPLGPIRLDLGINENGKSRTHFMIGHAF